MKGEFDQALRRAATAQEGLEECDRELGSSIQQLQLAKNGLKEKERHAGALQATTLKAEQRVAQVEIVAKELKDAAQEYSATSNRPNKSTAELDVVEKTSGYAEKRLKESAQQAANGREDAAQSKERLQQS